MALGKQAKIISDKQVRAILVELSTRRYPVRDRAMFLFSTKAGMRAMEIASVTWAMVTDADGEKDDKIALDNRAAKGRAGGRAIPMQVAQGMRWGISRQTSSPTYLNTKLPWMNAPYEP